jgi:hypothetical protein
MTKKKKTKKKFELEVPTEQLKVAGEQKVE